MGRNGKRKGERVEITVGEIEGVIQAEQKEGGMEWEKKVDSRGKELRE